MSDPTTLETLRGIKFFEGMSDENLKLFAEIATPVEFSPHTLLFKEQDKAKDVYVIVEGRVSLISCASDVGCRELMTVADGELVGWSPLVGRVLLSDTARTVTATKALTCDGAQVLDFCRKHPEFGFEFMHRVAQVLSERLNATRHQHLRMSGHQLPDVQIESD